MTRTTAPELTLDLTTTISTTTATVPAPAPEPFDYMYSFADQHEYRLGSWTHLLSVLGLVGQDGVHAYLFVRQGGGQRTTQCIGNARENLLAVEVGLSGEWHEAVVRPSAHAAPLVSATCAADGITRTGGRFTSLRSYVLTAPNTYFLTVLEAARAIQYWLECGTAPAGLVITPDTLP